MYLNHSFGQFGFFLLFIELSFSKMNDLWAYLEDGIAINEIENILFFILFIRFVILSIKYNFKTSFLITCVGIFAGYLWYRHLLDMILMYKNLLVQTPFLRKLGYDGLQMSYVNKQRIMTELNLQGHPNFHWYNPIQIIYYAVTNASVTKTFENMDRYYIDPISMFVSNLPEFWKFKLVPIYYTLYHKLIPQFMKAAGRYWSDISGLSLYSLMTRTGKKYCPYLIRWHWTFLLILEVLESPIRSFIDRLSYFQIFVIAPQIRTVENRIDYNFVLQFKLINALIMCIMMVNIAVLIFGLFHAIWGQYFYFPFLVENTELHIGPRDKDNIYNGGNTAWQDSSEKNDKQLFPKLWYGWLGRGTKNNPKKNLLQKILLKLIKRFRKKKK